MEPTINSKTDCGLDMATSLGEGKMNSNLSRNGLPNINLAQELRPENWIGFVGIS